MKEKCESLHSENVRYKYSGVKAYDMGRSVHYQYESREKMFKTQHANVGIFQQPTAINSETEPNLEGRECSVFSF